MVIVAAIGTVAHYALIKALDYAEAGAVQPYSYTLLVWVTAGAVFGDVPDDWTILGARSWWRAVSTPAPRPAARAALRPADRAQLIVRRARPA